MAAVVKPFYRVRNIHTLFLGYPEWITWLFSLLACFLLTRDLFPVTHTVHQSTLVIYCTPSVTIQRFTDSAQTVQPIFFVALAMIKNGLVSWIIMIAAMMFPLLSEPVKHVAFSVRRSDRNFAILLFLIGYTLIWTIAGLVYLLIPLLLTGIPIYQSKFANGLILSSGFLLTAALIWLPNRPVKMMKCGQTIPIRIKGWQLYWDSFNYGLKSGIACLNTCWAVMLALTLSHHNILIMFLATIILVYERYIFLHTSRISSFLWVSIALMIFSVEMFM